MNLSINRKLQKLRYFLRTGLKGLNVPTHATIDELNALFEAAKNIPREEGLLEIGSHYGATMICIGAATRKTKNLLYAVDTWKNETMPEGSKDTFAIFKKNCKHLEKRLTPLRINSKSLTKKTICSKLGLIFIDGNHAYEYFSKDLDYALNNISSSGTVICHDFCREHPGVLKKIAEEIIKKTITVESCVHHLLFIRKLKK